MSDQFANSILRHVVSLLCYNVGYDASSKTSLDILSDLLRRQLLQLAKCAHKYSEHYGRTEPNLDDFALTLRDLNISPTELEEYVQNFDPVSLAYAPKVPEFPLKRESRLNFLRPGSEEGITRPVHVHEYLPPMMIAEPKEAETESTINNNNKEDNEELKQEEGNKEQDQQQDKKLEGEKGAATETLEEATSSAVPSAMIQQETNGPAVPAAAVQKPSEEKEEEKEEEEDESSEDEIEAMGKSQSGGSGGFVPFSSVTAGKLAKSKRIGENPALKRVRKMMEEEGHPVREVTSAIMTTSGFLSSSREGRLPDTRRPANLEFFDMSPPPPPPEKKAKKSIPMKKILEGVKKISKENQVLQVSDQEEEEEEPALFGVPDKISTKAVPPVPPVAAAATITTAASAPLHAKPTKKNKKALRINKDMMKKIAQELGRRDLNSETPNFIKKAQNKLSASKRKKSLEKRQAGIIRESIMKREEEEEEEEEGEMEEAEFPIHHQFPHPIQQQQQQSFNRIPKKGKTSGFGLVDPVKLKKLKHHKSLSQIPSHHHHFQQQQQQQLHHHQNPVLAPPKLFAGGLGGPGGGRPRGRPPKKQQIQQHQQQQQQMLQSMFPQGAGGGVPIPPGALANLGRGLMDDRRPFKIKKSHMEPDMRSLIPEVQLDVPPPMMTKKGPKPPKMQPAAGQSQNLDLLMGLPPAPGLIPSSSGGGSNFGGLPPPPPLKKMPSTSAVPPAIQITPATQSTPPVKEGKMPFSNVCSSVTITPIEMGGGAGGGVSAGGGPQKMPARFSEKKMVPPGISSPPVLKAKPKDKSSPPTTHHQQQQQQMQIKSEPSSGITITPIMMENSAELRYSQGHHHQHQKQMQEGYDEPMELGEGEGEEEDEEEEYDEEYERPQRKTEKSLSMLAKLDEEMKSKEQRKKDKERRKELKKEKKDKKKDKEKKRDKADKGKEKKKKNKEKLLLLAESAAAATAGGVVSSTSSSSLHVPKLTLKLSSGTPTPVDSPNPPQVLIGEPSPPLKKITIKQQFEEPPVKGHHHHHRRTPSPELARFLPLVTRPPKPARAAKTNAAAGIAAEALGSSLSEQIFLPAAALAGPKKASGGGGGRGRNPSKGGGEKSSSSSSSSKASKAQGGLVTETVGVIEDEHGNKIWICPHCGRQDDGSPMVGCDRCDDWYHFPCVGIVQEPPEDAQWYCPRCVKKVGKGRKH